MGNKYLLDADGNVYAVNSDLKPIKSVQGGPTSNGSYSPGPEMRVGRVVEITPTEQKNRIDVEVTSVYDTSSILVAQDDMMLREVARLRVGDIIQFYCIEALDCNTGDGREIGTFYYHLYLLNILKSVQLPPVSVPKRTVPDMDSMLSSMIQTGGGMVTRIVPLNDSNHFEIHVKTMDDCLIILWEEDGGPVTPVVFEMGILVGDLINFKGCMTGYELEMKRNPNGEAPVVINMESIELINHAKKEA